VRDAYPISDFSKTTFTSPTALRGFSKSLIAWPAGLTAKNPV
jgi:hypothetical protein